MSGLDAPGAMMFGADWLRLVGPECRFALSLGVFYFSPINIGNAPMFLKNIGNLPMFLDRTINTKMPPSHVVGASDDSARYRAVLLGQNLV